jgi:L-ascorbate metabolism protein UlaG (beta-lactamase superfamily)
MADMQIIHDLHSPDIGVLSAGGHFTMDMRRVAYAAKKFFKFKTLIPGHYRTFPILEQSADLLVRELPEVEVIEPEVLEPIRFT